MIMVDWKIRSRDGHQVVRFTLMDARDADRGIRIRPSEQGKYMFEIHPMWGGKTYRVANTATSIKNARQMWNDLITDFGWVRIDTEEESRDSNT
jgi:hypothetical protein